MVVPFAYRCLGYGFCDRVLELQVPQRYSLLHLVETLLSALLGLIGDVGVLEGTDDVG
jgi:hypothetical protein